MNIVNRHSVRLPVAPDRVGALIDTLATAQDRLWPSACWPALRLDWPLMVAARGGHGPIRYTVEQYQPGQRVRFRFTAPAGFDGWHEFRCDAAGDAGADLIHELRMDARGLAVLSWPLVFRPLHDALIEDAFVRAQIALEQPAMPKPWSPRVRLLRFVLSSGSAAPQSALLSSSLAHSPAAILPNPCPPSH